MASSTCRRRRRSSSSFGSHRVRRLPGELRLHPARRVVEVGHRAAGRHQGVAGGGDLGVQRHLLDRDEFGCVLESPRADQRGRDARLVLAPEDRKLGRRDAGVGGEPGELDADPHRAFRDPASVVLAEQVGA